MKDFRVSITIKNNLLIGERERFGFTQMEMAKFLDVPLATLCKLEGLQTHPDKSPAMMDHAIKICERLEIPISKLFPKIFNKVKTPRIKGEATFAELQRLSAKDQPDPDMFEIEGQINKSLKTLPPRLEKIIRKKFGLGCEEMDVNDIADDERVCRERVMQLENKALRLLRCPVRSKTLKDYN